MSTAEMSGLWNLASTLSPRGTVHFTFAAVQGTRLERFLAALVIAGALGISWPSTTRLTGLSLRLVTASTSNSRYALVILVPWESRQ